MQLPISAATVLKILVIVTVFFVSAHICSFAIFSVYEPTYPPVIDIINRLDLNQEISLPTWASQILLALSAGLLGLITYYKKHRQQAYLYHWLILTIGFLYLSLDEGAMLHEIFNEPMADLFSTSSGYFHFAWVIPALLAVSLLAVIYLRFWLHLPRYTRFLLALATLTYVGGAVGVEMLSANHFSTQGQDTLPAYVLWGALEEGLEMLGASLFVYTFLDYLRIMKVRLALSFKD